MLTSGLTTPREVLVAAIATLVIPLAIGIYFAIISHWTILVISLIGAFSIVFYTNFLAKLMLGELFAGLALGSLVVLGTYIAMTANPGMQIGSIVPSEVEWLSVPPGILTGLLLFINEFPDREADLEGGRNHLVIRLGKKRAAWLYSACMVITFAIIMVLPLAGLSSYWIYLALFPIPFAVKASVTAVKFGDNYPKMVSALGSNVVAVLLTDLLLAAAIFIEVL
jgi:1,4-dihydroxy-2-naphthoate octaprenyltransferase